MTVPVKSEPQYVQVGASGLFVYRVGLGTMQFGWSVDEAGSVKVLDAYAEAGGNFIDTADSRVPIEETLSALTDLVRQGKVRYLGCSNYTAWRLVEALWASDRRHLESFVSVQPEYNLLDPIRGLVEMELGLACRRYGIGMFPYSPLGGGLLTGKYRRDQALPESVRAAENAEQRFSDKNWQIIETLVEVAEANDHTPAQAAINWMLSKPWVTAPIIGANTSAQLTDVLNGLDKNLPDTAIAQLDDASEFSGWEPLGRR